MCYLVKPDGAARWQLFCNWIAGFDYVAGTEYEVEAVPVAEPPADASNCTFGLHRILGRQQKTSEGLPEGAVLE